MGKENQPQKSEIKSITQRMQEVMEGPEGPDYNQMVIDQLPKRPLSKSSLSKFLISPRHYWEYCFGERPDRTHALDFGNIFDLMALTPERVEEEVFILPPLNLRTKADKEKLALIKEEHAGKFFCSEEDMEKALAMYRVYINDPEVQYLLSQMESFQETIYWTDPETGLRNIGKIDMRTGLYAKPMIVCDLKTGISADPLDWDRAIINFDYHLQAGGYCLAYEKKYFVYPEYRWIVIEKKPPYAVNIFKADDKLLKESKRLYLETLKAFKYCLDYKEFHKSHSFWRFMAPYNFGNLPGYYRTKI